MARTPNRHAELLTRFLASFANCTVNEYVTLHAQMADSGDVEPLDRTGRPCDRPEDPPLVLVPVQLPKPLYEWCRTFAASTGLPLSRIVSILASKGLIDIWEQAEREVLGLVGGELPPPLPN